MMAASGQSGRDLAAPARAPRIGELLVRRGILSLHQAGEVAQSHVELGIRFGEAAVRLGYISQAQLDAVLRLQLKTPMVAEPASVSPELFSFHDPHSVAAEDVRKLRNVLLQRWFQARDGGSAITLIGPSRGDGRSIVAANLAIAFAQLGKRTLLIDGDMRRPRQHDLFGLPNARGLADYLAGSTDDAVHYYLPQLPVLTVIPAGTPDASAEDLLLRPQLASLFEIALATFEVVLIDTPAGTSGIDYQILSGAARAAMLVARRKSTDLRHSARMLNECEEAGVKIVGGMMFDGGR